MDTSNERLRFSYQGLVAALAAEFRSEELAAILDVLKSGETERPGEAVTTLENAVREVYERA